MDKIMQSKSTYLAIIHLRVHVDDIVQGEIEAGIVQIRKESSSVLLSSLQTHESVHWSSLHIFQ